MSLAGHSNQEVHVMWVVASLIGGAIAMALVAIYRWAAKKVEREEVDRILEQDDDERSHVA